MKKLHLVTLCSLFLVFAASITSCERDNGSQLDDELEILLSQAAPSGMDVSYFKMPQSNDFSNIPQDPRNQLNIFKVALGKILFHETGLGIKPRIPMGVRQYSCASCHHAAAGFQANLAQGIGEGGHGYGIRGEGRFPEPSYVLDSIDTQPIRTPSAMNAAWQKVVLWNGQFGCNGPNMGTEAFWTPGTPKETNNLGYEGVETQAIAGLKVHRLGVDAQWIKSFQLYKHLFDNAFPEVPEADRYSRIYAGLAIAAYERTVMANRSPWQRWLSGERFAMTPLQKEGALLFFGKAGCNGCHTGPALNSMTFYGLGLGNLQNGNYGAVNVGADKPEHKGRGGFTGLAEDMFKFKTPQLYNLKDSPFYGHGATITSIREMIEYKNAAVPENPDVPASQLAPQFHPLGLSNSEIDALEAFVKDALYDPELSRYSPTSLPSGLAYPNNDHQSRVDLGFE